MIQSALTDKKKTDIINKFDALFGARTGVTVLMPQHPLFDGGIELPVSFSLSADNPLDIVFSGNGRHIILKNLRKDYLDEAVERGFLMVYETAADEEVVRCTHCTLSK